MRPLFALLLAFGLIGGMAGYIQFARSVHRPPSEYQADFATGLYEVELMRTFDCVADDLAELKALEVRFRGEAIFESAKNLQADERVRFEIPAGVENGENEISIIANRDFLDTELAAIRVTLFRNDVPLRKQTITSEPEIATVSGSVVFRVSDSKGHAHE